MSLALYPSRAGSSDLLGGDSVTLKHALRFAAFKAKENIDQTDITEHVTLPLGQAIDSMWIAGFVMVDRVNLSHKCHLRTAALTRRRLIALNPIWAAPEFAPLPQWRFLLAFL
jgi:hypothetical protein